MKMKNLIALMIVLGVAQAKADGFVCETWDGDLVVKVYNKTQPEDGTRNASVMVLSDPQVQKGRKTIARFQADNEVLTNHSARYEAEVDLRFSDSSRKGELIAGTKLGQLDRISLDVAFSYANPTEEGDEMDGTLVLEKRNGQTIKKQLTCVRYLKQ